MHVAAGGCKEDQFTCASGDECTLNEYMCDGDNDCADGSVRMLRCAVSVSSILKAME